MAWISIFIFLSTLYKIIHCDVVTSPIPPTPVYFSFVEQLMNNRLVNMTRDLVQDLHVKYESLRRINNRYKGTQSYELGYISAGIQDDFKNILEVYRTYCNIANFKNDTHSLGDILHAYHFIQGQYNDLRAQKILYFEAQVKFQKRKKFLDLLYTPLHHQLSVSHKRLTKLYKLPDEVLDDKENLGFNLKGYGIVPARIPLERVDRVVKMAVHEEMHSRRFDSEYSETPSMAQRPDFSTEIDKVYNDLKTFLRDSPPSIV